MTQHTRHRWRVQNKQSTERANTQKSLMETSHMLGHKATTNEIPNA